MTFQFPFTPVTKRVGACTVHEFKMVNGQLPTENNIIEIIWSTDELITTLAFLFYLLDSIRVQKELDG